MRIDEFNLRLPARLTPTLAFRDVDFGCELGVNGMTGITRRNRTAIEIENDRFRNQETFKIIVESGDLIFWPAECHGDP